MGMGNNENDVLCRLNRKTAIVNFCVPPMVYGSAGKVYRLFKHVAPDSYCIITSNTNADDVSQDGGQKLPCTYRFLPSEWRRLSVFGNRCRSLVLWMNLWLKVIQRARNIRHVLLLEQCKAVVSFTGECEDLPAAFMAAKMTGCQFFPVMDDDFFSQWTEVHKRWFAWQVGSFMVRHAERLFVVSDAMREEYKRRYGVEGHVLHTPTMGRVGATPSRVPIGQTNGEVRILFTGTVYELNADIVTSIISASAFFPNGRVKVDLYTWQTRDQLRALGVEGAYEVHKSLSPEAIQAVQRQSDILFLGLGFNPRHRMLAQTSFPSKLTDYLVSGRPILALAPIDSCTAEFLHKHQCGHVVERQDASSIADGIRLLISDEGYRIKLVQNAFEVARREFDYERVVSGLVNVINGKQSATT
jgi:hypothetical protein